MPGINIPLTNAVSEPSGGVLTLIDVLAQRSHRLASCVTPAGGVRVAELEAVLDPVVTEIGARAGVASTFSARALRWVVRSQRAAISLHGGRAHTNNEVLLAVLAAAADPDLDWLIAVLPEKYKGGPTFANVSGQLSDLADATGIQLSLTGVTLLAF